MMMELGFEELESKSLIKMTHPSFQQEHIIDLSISMIMGML